MIKLTDLELVGDPKHPFYQDRVVPIELPTGEILKIQVPNSFMEGLPKDGSPAKESDEWYGLNLVCGGHYE